MKIEGINTDPRSLVAQAVADGRLPAEALEIAIAEAGQRESQWRVLDLARKNDGGGRALGVLKSRAPYVEAIARALDAGDFEDAQRLMIQEVSGRTATFGAPIGNVRPFLGKNRKERRAEAAKRRGK